MYLSLYIYIGTKGIFAILRRETIPNEEVGNVKNRSMRQREPELTICMYQQNSEEHR